MEQLINTSDQPAAKSGRHQFGIFALVGILNTLVDLTIFLALREIPLPIVLANIFSSSAALACSFVLNRKFTFNSKKAVRKSLPVFIGVTLAGIWVLQPLVIIAVLALFDIPMIAIFFESIVSGSEKYHEPIAKLAGTPPTLIWNFLLYRTIVFKTKSD